MLNALKPQAESVDPGGVTVLVEMYARVAAGLGEETNGGNVDGADGGAEDGGMGGSLQGLLASLPAPSSDAKSALVDLGRTALKVDGAVSVLMCHARTQTPDAADASHFHACAPETRTTETFHRWLFLFQSVLRPLRKTIPYEYFLVTRYPKQVRR